MKGLNWIYITLSLFLTLSSCNESTKPDGSMDPELEFLPGSYVYLGTEPGNCGMDLYSFFFEHTWYICVHAPDAVSTGVYFWIEPFAFGAEDSVSIDPSEGTDYEGDLLTGMTMHWPADSFDHKIMLTLTIIDNPPYNYYYNYIIAQTHDAELFLEDGRTAYLENVASTPVYCGSYGGGTNFRTPDYFVVHPGSEETLAFEGIGSQPGEGPVATDIHAVDQLGWVGVLTPDYLWTTCSDCPWFWTEFQLQVHVPLSTPEGTRNLVNLYDVNEKLLTSFEIVAEKR